MSSNCEKDSWRHHLLVSDRYPLNMTSPLSRIMRHSCKHSTTVHCVFPIIKNFENISSHKWETNCIWCYKLQIFRINSLASLFLIKFSTRCYYSVRSLIRAVTRIPTVLPKIEFLNCVSKDTWYLSGDRCFSFKFTEIWGEKILSFFETIPG